MMELNASRSLLRKKSVYQPLGYRRFGGLEEDAVAPATGGEAAELLDVQQGRARYVAASGAGQSKVREEKIRFPDKQDKTTIEYNPWITIAHNPQTAHNYVVNGQSVVEWIMERYQIRTDKVSSITNDWATRRVEVHP